MTDIFIVKRHNRTIISPSSAKGHRWIKDNILITYGTTVVIDSDLLEAFIKHLEEAKITYEER